MLGAEQPAVEEVKAAMDLRALAEGYRKEADRLDEVADFICYLASGRELDPQLSPHSGGVQFRQQGPAGLSA